MSSVAVIYIIYLYGTGYFEEQFSCIKNQSEEMHIIAFSDGSKTSEKFRQAVLAFYLPQRVKALFYKHANVLWPDGLLKAPRNELLSINVYSES